jgi:cell division protein FtsI/penicillin-binding protein 2
MKRINFLMAIVLLMALFISARLFQKSVLEHTAYTALAENQQKVEKETSASRGQIFAYEDPGKTKTYPLATSVEKYTVNVVPKNIVNAKDVANKLAPILELKEEDIFNAINNQKLYIPPLKKRIEKGKADQIKNFNLKGVLIAAEDTRFYPENMLGSQFLGFVDNEGEGKYGLEGYYNSELKGQAGYVIADRDALGRILFSNQNQESQNGSDLYLTIDHNLQYFVEQKLAESKEKYQADSGTIIVMDPKTGAILAMASNPSYDPNKFNEIPQDQQNLFMNPAISFVWEPGSIFKPFCMAAAVNEGKVEPDTKGTFSNMTVVQGYEIHTAQDKAFGEETMTQVLENSDNVAMVWVADQLGNETYYNYIKKFGFDAKTNIDLVNEVNGNLLALKNWRDVSRANISFGQGISVTPLQMVAAYSAIANGGKLSKPYMVDKIVKSNGEEIITKSKTTQDVISAESATKLTSMLISVVENGHGKKAKVPGFSVAGKTGTAQIPNPEGGYFEDKHVGSFAGFFPADNPQFAMVVKLDNPKNVEWAESSAAPTFGEIAAWMLNYYQIQPTQ